MFEVVAPLIQDHRNIFRVIPEFYALMLIDDETFIHSVNVALISYLFGKWLGLSEDDKEVLLVSGLLHDIGKLKIKKGIIKKPGTLTDEEYEEMKRHAEYGYDILKNQKIDERIKLVALMHHERCDGSGYPQGLYGNQIEHFAKIVAIADVYDALTSNRIYRDGICPFEVIEIYENEGYHQFGVEYITPFLAQITETFIGATVCLSDGREGKIVMINEHRASKPIVQVDGIYIDLSRVKGLRIQSVISPE